MKDKMHPKKEKVFDEYAVNLFKRLKKHYMWPQICYDWDSAQPIHIVFEKNNANKDAIQWPLSTKAIASTSIDFTNSPPTLDDGANWDYNTWYKSALNCRLQKESTAVPASFWDWREDVIPQDNATCDMDLLVKTQNGLVGIEATQIFHVEESSNKEHDVYEHFHRLFRFRKNFNIKQLQAQKNFFKKTGDGKLFMIFHLIIDVQGKKTICDGRGLLLEVTDEFFDLLNKILSTRSDYTSEIKQIVKFINIKEYLEDLANSSEYSA